MHQDTYILLGHLGYSCTASRCPLWCADGPLPAVQAKSLETLPHDPSLVWNKPSGPSQNWMPPTVPMAGSSLSLALSFPHCGLCTGLLPCHHVRHSTTPFTKQLKAEVRKSAISLSTQNHPVTSVHSRESQGPYEDPWQPQPQNLLQEPLAPTMGLHPSWTPASWFCLEHTWNFCTHPSLFLQSLS